MTGFAGWNFIGASSSILKEQGVNIVLNLFGGPSLNAARGIASQVNSAISGFVGNFMTALNPQITKLYASGEYGHMTSLISWSTILFLYVIVFILAGNLEYTLCTDAMVDYCSGTCRFVCAVSFDCRDVRIYFKSVDYSDAGNR